MLYGVVELELTAGNETWNGNSKVPSPVNVKVYWLDGLINPVVGWLDCVII